MTIKCIFCYTLHFCAEADKNSYSNIDNRLLFEDCYKKEAIKTESLFKYSLYLINLFIKHHEFSH